jgi:Abortive infection alpha
MNEETIRAGADATKEVAVTGGKAIDLAGKLTQYLDGTLRAFFGNAEDNMEFRRWENRIKLIDKAAKRLQERGLDGPTREVPVKFALPLLTYATLEEDDELQDIWAQMLANAADASSRVELRTAYIDILKDLTAFDIMNLSQLAKLSMSDLPQEYPPLIHTQKLPDSAEVNTTMKGNPGRPSEEVLLSLSNLNRAGCISPTYGFGGMPLFSQVAVTAIGMGLYRACTKPRI